MRRLYVAALALALVLAFFAVTSTLAAGPTPVNDLRIARSGTSAVLTWTHADASVQYYEVWWSDSPYALIGDPGMVHVADVAPGAVGGIVSYTDAVSGVGNTAVSSFYAVRGVTAGGEVSVLSNRAGEFDYGLNGIQPALPIVDHCGTISANQTWGPNAIHRLTCDVVIASGVRLLVLPGTVVKPQTTTVGITVNGTLEARGSAQNQVYFTSYKDDSAGGDTNGDGAVTAPAKGDWEGTYVTSTGRVEMSYATLRYGGDTASSYDAILYLYNNAVGILDHVTIAESEYLGIYAYASGSGTTTSLTFSNGAVENNANTGIYAARGSGVGLSVSLTGSTIRNNGSYGFHMPYANGVELTGNTFVSNSSYAAYLAFVASTAVALSANSGSGNGRNGIALAGTIGQNTTLPVNPGFPYIIPSSNLTVNSGAALTLPEGSVVKMESTNSEFRINGVLLSQGTASNPVTITSFKDDSVGGDTNNDGSASVPAPMDAGVIQVNSDGVATLDHTVMRYGGKYNNVYGLHLSVSVAGKLTLSHSTISDSHGNGIYLRTSATQTARLEIFSSTIENNRLSGVVVTSDSTARNNQLMVSDSFFRNNGSTGLSVSYAQSATITNSEFNNNTGNGFQANGILV